MSELQSHGLRSGSLGATAIALIVISAVAPMTNLAGVLPIAILFGQGPSIAPAFIVTMVLLLIFSIGYVAIARHVTNAGAFYTIIRKGLGDTVGGAAASIALFGYNGLQIGVYGLYGAVFAYTVEQTTGISLPWWVYSVVTCAIVYGLAYRRIDLTAKVLVVLVIAEFAAVLFLDLAILWKGVPGGLSLEPLSFSSAPSLQAIGITFVYAFGCYAGFEATTVYREEAIDPDRSIPLATYAAVLIIGIFYSLSTIWIVQAVDTKNIVPIIQGLPDPVQFVFMIARDYVGAWLETFMRVLFITSLFACILAFHNHIARYFYVLARDGMLPEWVGRTHSVNQTPHRASLIQTIITLVVIGIFAGANLDPILNLFAWVGNIAVLAVLVVMIMVCLSIIYFFSRSTVSDKPGFIVTKLAPLLAGAGFAAITWYGVTGFDILTGVTGPAQYVLPALIPIVGVLGMAHVVRNKRHMKLRALQT